MADNQAEIKENSAAPAADPGAGERILPICGDDGKRADHEADSDTGERILSMRGITKDYVMGSEVSHVLKGIDLDVNRGEFLAVLGPSGSGKSTLMNIIGCLDKPTSGEFTLDGKDMLALTDNELSEIRAHKIGFVFQSFQLLKGETAIQNVMLPLSFAGVKRNLRRDIALKALERVGLAERVNFLPTQLSGGQKQRVAIARALVNNPDIILADEPTGALDQKSGKSVMELFEQLNREGVTIILITHDENVGKRANRLLHIVDGEILEHKQKEAQDEE